MAKIEMTLRGRLLLLVPIYLIVAGFLLQNPYLPVVSAALFSIFLYSRYYFGGSGTNIQITNKISKGEKYVDEKFYLTQEIFSKQPLFFDIEFGDADEIEVKSDINFSGTISSYTEIKHKLVPKERGYKQIGTLKGHIFDPMKLYKQGFYKEGDQEITAHSSKEAIKRAQRYSKRVKSDLNVKDFSKYITRTAELDTIRDYQPGDRMRDIHWKSMSKFQSLMTKTYEKITPVDCQIMIDCSPSMRRGKKDGKSKLEHSIFLAIEFLKNFELSGHDFGLTVFDHKKTIYHHPPDHKRETFQSIYKDLSDLPGKIETKGYKRTRYDIEKQSEVDDEQEFTKIVGEFFSGTKKSELSGILSAVQRIKTSSENSLVIIISDLETSTRSFIKAIESLKQRDTEIWVLIPFSPWYLIDEIDDEVLEKTYTDFEGMERVIHQLKRLEVSTFLLHPSTEGIEILTKKGGKRL